MKKKDKGGIKKKAESVRDRMNSGESGDPILFTIKDRSMEIDVVSVFDDLNYITGVGGLPRGRIIEFFGLESSGKSSLALHCVAAVQNLGELAVYIDAEHSLNLTLAKKLGVDIENLLISQPDYGEQALDIAEKLIPEVGIVVIDSVSALVPKDELEGNMGEFGVGVQARMMGQALRKLVGKVSQHQCIIIFVNQLRMKIGTLYGNPYTTSGGNALKFYASLRIEVSIVSSGSAQKEGEKAANDVRIKAVKNKLAPPFRQKVCRLFYGEGFTSLERKSAKAKRKEIKE